VATCEAIVFRGAGGAEVIGLGETEVADPGPGEVQIEIAAAGVNRADVLQRRGFYPAPPGSPADVPGLELAGRVVARGPGATLWPDGAEVMAITGGGAMARRITMHERALVPVPAGMPLVDAAAIPEVFFTAWDALIRQARLGAGEDVVIHAATSGIGTGRQAAKLARLAELGLPDGDAIVVEGARFAAAVAERTGGRGAAVVLDCIGAAYFEENIRALATRGRMVMLGALGGATGTAPIGMMLGKRVTVTGSVLRARPLEEKIALAREVAARLVPLFERGLLRPVVDQVLPMAACAEAHARMEANANVGKLVLRW